jgi:hypothetical protein
MQSVTCMRGKEMGSHWCVQCVLYSLCRCDRFQLVRALLGRQPVALCGCMLHTAVLAHSEQTLDK